MSERKISEKSLENLRKSNQESNFLTREAIETALLQLLEKKDLAKISISELVKRAGVSRAAFYRNYDSKEAILESVFKRSVHNIMEQLSHYDVKTDLYLVWVHLFRAAKKKPRLSNSLWTTTWKRFLSKLCRNFWKNTTENQKVLAATFIPFGVLPSYRFCSNGSRMA